MAHGLLTLTQLRQPLVIRRFMCPLVLALVPTTRWVLTCRRTCVRLRGMDPVYRLEMLVLSRPLATTIEVLTSLFTVMMVALNREVLTRLTVSILATLVRTAGRRVD